MMIKRTPRAAHKIPVAKTTEMPIFCFSGICKDDMQTEVS